MAAGESAIQTFESSGGRRLTLAFAFLVLLPFYASLGPMLVQRLSRGFVLNSIVLGILGIAFTALMALILQQLIHAVRTRIVLTDSGLRATVPAVGARGPFFFWSYVTREIPFSDVAGVETRSEVYGRKLAPVLLTSTRIVTRSGPPLVLGYVNANDSVPQMPYSDIGREVAARAGVTVADRGSVHHSLLKRATSTAQDNETAPLEAAEIAAINVAHARNVRLLVGALVLLVIGGIGIDFATASRTGFAAFGVDSAAKPAPPTAKKQ